MILSMLAVLASTKNPVARSRRFFAELYVDRLLDPRDVSDVMYRQAPPMKNPKLLAVHIAATTAKGGR